MRSNSAHDSSRAVLFVRARGDTLRRVELVRRVPEGVQRGFIWDARDDANGRVTIDLGANYEPALTKRGLPRVLE